MKKHIVVFAGNECIKEKEDHYFSVAYKLGELLAQNGLVTVTGGGPGLMDAVCKGAFENGGETVGVCLVMPGRIHSKYLTRSTKHDVLNIRQDELIKLGDGFIALPGGIGTIHEISAILTMKRKGEIPKEKSMILVDPYFTPFVSWIETMRMEGFVSNTFPSLFQHLETPEDAVDALTKSFNTV